MLAAEGWRLGACEAAFACERSLFSAATASRRVPGSSGQPAAVALLKGVGDARGVARQAARVDRDDDQRQHDPCDLLLARAERAGGHEDEEGRGERRLRDAGLNRRHGAHGDERHVPLEGAAEEPQRAPEVGAGVEEGKDAATREGAGYGEHDGEHLEASDLERAGGGDLPACVDDRPTHHGGVADHVERGPLPVQGRLQVELAPEERLRIQHAQDADECAHRELHDEGADPRLPSRILDLVLDADRHLLRALDEEHREQRRPGSAEAHEYGEPRKAGRRPAVDLRVVVLAAELFAVDRLRHDRRDDGRHHCR
mmetsp:Transcript_31979/g.84565  ORF Transcript_31979/g.84565 Transcript_31979/m.84565 type:complete len:313 (-) Transcript_31979:551-1489(-)